jgi:hypothetical protein
MLTHLKAPAVVSLAALLGLSACAGDPDRAAGEVAAVDGAGPGELAGDESAARRGAAADEVVQAGAGLLPLAVTEDDQAFYQDGQTLYVTALGRRAARTKIADIPAGNVAFIYTSGKVAFIWTNPDLTSPSFGVSPLVIWTARDGAHAASDASAVGTLLTAASRDGRHVVFPTHASADGRVGDVGFATTDLREVGTLLTGIQTDFSNGPCRPLGAFLGDGDAAAPAIAHCPGADTASTLSIFGRGGRRDLAGLVNPPRLSVDSTGHRLLTERASATNPRRGTPLMITERDVTVVEDVVASGLFFNADGAVIYFAADAATGQLSTRRARRGAIDPVTPSLVAVFGTGFGSTALAHPLSSRDGRWLAYGTASDPATGLANLALVDLRAPAPEATIVALDAAVDNGNAAFEEPFTQDSQFVLTSKPDLAAGTQQMFATSVRSHERQALSDPTGFSVIAAAGSFVVLNDHAQIDPTNFALSTADLKVANAAAGGSAPRVIARGANISFFLDHARTRIVYATDEAGRAGLRVARVW